MRLDLHVHSRHSFDSLSDPIDILRTAKRRGLDGIAVTDHNTIKGALETMKANRDEGFTVVVGAEYATDAGDIIGLFLNEEIPPTRNPFEVIDRIRAQDGLVVLPHPYKGHKLDDELLRHVDAVEGFNARVSEKSNRMAQELGRDFGKPLVAGSDAHVCREIGNSVMTTGFSDVRSGILGEGSRCSSRRSPFAAILFSQAIGVLRRKRYSEMPRALGAVVGERGRGR